MERREDKMGCYKRKLSEGEFWFYSGQYKGQKYHSKAEYTSKNDCRKAEAEKLEKLEKEIRNPRQKMTLKELCNKRLDFIQTARSKAYYKDNRLCFQKFLDSVGNIEVDRVTRAMIHSHLLKEATRLKKEGKGNYQVNADLRYIRALLNSAIELEILETNPTDKIKFYSIEKEVKYIPPEKHIEMVMDYVLCHQRMFLIFLRDTGARASEALRSKAEDIDLKRNTLKLWTRKKRYSNLSFRIIKLPESIKSLAAKEGLLFPQFSDRPKFLDRACKHIGIPEFGFHAFRHMAALRMADAGIQIIYIQEFLGHESQSTTEIYLKNLGWLRKH